MGNGLLVLCKSCLKPDMESASGKKTKCRNTLLEIEIHHLYSLELTCDKVPERAAAPSQLNAKAPIFCSKRDIAVAATLRIHYAIKGGNFKT